MDGQKGKTDIEDKEGEGIKDIVEMWMGRRERQTQKTKKEKEEIYIS